MIKHFCDTCGKEQTDEKELRTLSIVGTDEYGEKRPAIKPVSICAICKTKVVEFIGQLNK